MNSTVVPTDVWERYLEYAEKMKRDLKCSSQEDNRWVLKSWDFNGVGVVKIFCIECRKEIGRDSGKHDKTNIQNLFNNFKTKHLQSTNHVNNWCVENDINYHDHLLTIAPKGKGIHFTPEMHKKLIGHGIDVMEEVNLSLDVAPKTFTVLGTFKDYAPKNFWMKVRCFYCKDLISLCPPPQEQPGMEFMTSFGIHKALEGS
jgi:hypothetical protein